MGSIGTVGPLLLGATAVSAGIVEQQRQWWAWWMSAVAILVLAYLTNPTPASFRTHLTSLSFHTHLRRLSSSSGGNSPTGTTNNNNNNNNTPGRPRRSSSAASNTTPSLVPPKPKPLHILSFSNRISLAVRTPVYQLKDYVFFSTAFLHAPPPSSSARTLKDDAAQQGTLWIGAFGRWYAWKWDGEAVEEKERRGRVRWGVKSLEVEEDDSLDLSDRNSNTSASDLTTTPPSNDSAPSSTSPFRTTPHLPLPRALNNSKRPSRPNQRRPPSPMSLARLRSKADLPPPPTPAISIITNGGNGSGNGNAHVKSPSETDGFYRERERDKGLPGLPFHVDDLAAGALPTITTTCSTSTSTSTATTTATPASAEPDPPTPDATGDPLLSELSTQLAELRVSSAEAEKRLLADLEVLRGRKKEEDSFRAELKGKTKGLEETKRAAEMARVEAEREIGERRTVVREMEERVRRVEEELREVERRDAEASEKRRRKARERKERERRLKEDVGKKKEELKAAEEGREKIKAKVRGMEKTIEARREMLFTRRAEVSTRPQAAVAVGYGPAQHRGGFGRAPGAYGGYSVNNSRPASIKSAHFDPHHPSNGIPNDYSPPTSPPVSPNDDHSPYSDMASAAAAAFYGGGTFAHGSATALHGPGFLEHRIAHRRTDYPSTAAGPYIPSSSTLPSVGDIPAHFLPFDFDSREHSSDDLSSLGTNSKPNRPQLSLPLQYLDSGLLAGSDSPGAQGPLSPMTPHQTSLIPSQLFDMLDEDDEDDFRLPDSPTFGRGASGGGEWLGALGLENLPSPRDRGADGIRVREDSLSPILSSPTSPFSPSDVHTSPFSASSVATALEHHASPWGSTDQLLSAKPLSSPTGGPGGPDDDLPRHGLMLNPGAKAFAFQPRAAQSPHAPSPSIRAATVPQTTTSSLAAATAFGPPAKSRMDFSSAANVTQGAAVPAAGGRFSFDWQRGEGTGAAGRTLGGVPAMSFNPFDGEDEILGPLKR